MAPPARALLSLLLASAACSRAGAMKGQEDLTIASEIFGRWEQFGYFAGGSLSMVQTVTNVGSLRQGTVVWSLVCTSSEFESILSLDPSDVCPSKKPDPGHVNLTNVCFAAQMMGADNATLGTVSSWTLKTTIPDTSFYQFLIISCYLGDSPMQLDVSYHFVNPGGEELSSGAVPLKPITRSFSIVWGVLGVLLLANMAYAKACYAGPPEAPASDVSVMLDEPAVRSPVRTLHFALLGVIAFKAVDAALENSLWVSVSRTGEIDAGLQWGSVAGADFSSACLIAVIMLLSRGWQVTRLTVETYEYRHVVFMLFLYCFSWICWQLLGQFFWLFLLVLVYVLLLRYLFASVSWRLRVLQGFRQFVNMLGYQRSVAAAEENAAATRATDDDIAYAQYASGASVPAYTYADAPQAPAAGVAPIDATGYQLHADAAVSSAAAPARTEETAALLSLNNARERSANDVEVRRQRNMGWRAAYAVRDWWSSLGRSGENPNLTTRQIRALVHFRTAILIYLTLDVMSQVWATLALDQHPWVGVLLTQTWNVSMVLYLVFLFRARTNPSKSMLYDPRQYTGSTFEQLLDTQQGDTASVGADHGTPHRIVVQNPDSMDATGKAVPSVVLAELSDRPPPSPPLRGAPRRESI